jgi:hypothetical protein
MHIVSFIGDIHQPLHVSRTTDKGGNTITVQYHLLDKHQFPIQVRHVQRSPLSSTDVGSAQHYDHHHHHRHSWNLHSIWDTALIETALEREFNNLRSNMEVSLEAMLEQHPEWTQHYASCGGGGGGNDYDDERQLSSSSSSGLNITCVIGWGQESWEYALKYAYTKNEPWDSAAANTPVEVADGDTIDEEYYQTRIEVVKERLIAGGVRLALTLENIFGDQGNHTNSMDIKDFVGSSVLSLWSKILVVRQH